MSYIESINQAATAQTQAAQKKDDKSKDIMGKEDFLTLLVAQLKNQDPLNPTDSVQFLTQLAQFSELEQMIGIRQDLTDLGGVLAAGNDAEGEASSA